MRSCQGGRPGRVAREAEGSWSAGVFQGRKCWQGQKQPRGQARCACQGSVGLSAKKGADDSVKNSFSWKMWAAARLQRFPGEELAEPGSEWQVRNGSGHWRPLVEGSREQEVSPRDGRTGPGAIASPGVGVDGW